MTRDPDGQPLPHRDESAADARRAPAPVVHLAARRPRRSAGHLEAVDHQPDDPPPSAA